MFAAHSWRLHERSSGQPRRVVGIGQGPQQSPIVVRWRQHGQSSRNSLHQRRRREDPLLQFEQRDQGAQWKGSVGGDHGGEINCGTTWAISSVAADFMRRWLRAANFFRTKRSRYEGFSREVYKERAQRRWCEFVGGERRDDLNHEKKSLL